MLNASHAKRWRIAMMALPPAVAILTSAAAALVGAFDNFQWTGQTISAPGVLGLMGTICFPVAAYLFARRKWEQALARDSQAWPTVPGVVQWSQIERKHMRSVVLHSLAVRYRYEVGDRTYEGETLAFAPRWFPDEAKVKRLAGQYATGAKVVVRVDPAAPHNAVLETSEDLARQAAWRIWISLVAPFVAALIASLRSL